MSQLPYLICPRNSVTKCPLFLRNALTPVPRNNVARYRLRMHDGQVLHRVVAGLQDVESERPPNAERQTERLLAVDNEFVEGASSFPPRVSERMRLQIADFGTNPGKE